MSENQPKDSASVRIFPPGAPLVTILAGVFLQWQAPLGFPLALVPAVRLTLGGLIILGTIYFLGWRAVRTMRGTGQSENPYKPTTEIVEKGPFRLTRNPMYLQMVIACLGFSVLLANVWIALLTPLCWLALDRLVVRQEEAYLERKFGDAYLGYKQRVPRWL